MRALRKNLTANTEFAVAGNLARAAVYRGYPVLAAATPAATVDNEGGLKKVALLIAAPFIGLGWFLLFPFIGLAMLATMAVRALAKVAVAHKVLTFAKNLGLFLAAPFIGLGYFVLFPFIGMGMLVVTAVKALMHKPAAA